MSKYTTEVRFICEKYAGYNESVGYSGVENILDKSWDKIFDFQFPIFDENYRPILCKKILKHYYTREIGFETVALWKLKLDMAMNEIMPYYNQLYESTLLKFDPLNDADYTKTHEGSDSGEGEELGTHTGTVTDELAHGGTVTDTNLHTGTVTDAGTHGGTIRDQGTKEGNIDDVGNEQVSETTWDVYSDTPQGALTNVDQNTYLTNARKITHELERDTTNNRDYDEETDSTRTFNETTGNTRTFNEQLENEREYDETNENSREYDEATSTNRTYENTNEYIEHIVGKFPGRSFSKMLQEFRDTFLNIDVDVIGDLSDLFIKLW